MGIVTDMQYAGLMAPYLRNYRRKNSGYEFSCPICGDSTTNRRKARGNLYRNGTRLHYQCYNCNTPISSLRELLPLIDPALAEQYVIDSFQEWRQEQPKEREKQPQHSDVNTMLIKISKLDPTHPAKRYVMERQIPSNMHYQIFYTRTFFTFAKEVDPSIKFDPHTMQDHPRIVIPLMDRQGKVAGYQGRSLDANDSPKYLTILHHPDNSRLYGLDRVDLNQQVRCLEGPIDSMFVHNAVASCGSKIEQSLPAAGIGKDRALIIYDNEPRSEFTVKKMEAAVRNGFSVVVWPQDLIQTDINQMILDGYSVADVEQIITERTFSGLAATLEISQWRRTCQSKRNTFPRAPTSF